MTAQGGAMRNANALRAAPRSAWLLPAATLILAGAGLALLAWDWSTPVPRGFFGIRGMYGLFAAGFGGVGAVLTWRRPGHLVGWVLAAAGLLAAASFATIEYGLAASAGHRLPGAGYVGWVETWIWVPFLTLITVYLFLLFPDGRLPAPRWRPVAWLGGAFATLAATGAALTAGSERPNLPALRNPFGLAPAAVPLGAAVAGLSGLVCCALLAAWSLVVRSRRGTHLTQQQIKWLAYAGCLVAAALVPGVALSLTPGWPAQIASGAVSVAALAMPAAVAVAVLHYRLYDIDRIISRTLAYAIITGVLAGLYAGLVLLATGVLGMHTPVAVAAATLSAAALFAPLRRRVQRAADRRFNRVRYDADQAVAAFAARLKGAVDLDTIREDLADVVQTTLEPAGVWIWTARPSLPTKQPRLSGSSAPSAPVGSRLHTSAHARSNDSDRPFTQDLPP
jgi:hypothetical protein